MSFELFSLDPSLFPKNMRDVFKSLVDRDTKEGYLRSIPSNYGYVSFWFGFLDQKTLSRYYKGYVSKDKLREIEEAKRNRLREFEEAGIEDTEGLFDLSDYVRDQLFSIAYDHTDIIGKGLAQVYLAVLFDRDLKETTINEAISILKTQAEKLETINDLADKIFRREIPELNDIEIDYQTIEFADNEDSNETQIREGWEIKLSINFDGDDTLRETIERIDKAISPLKETLTRMIRYESSFFPF